MSNELFNEEGHLTGHTLKKLKFGTLKDEELLFVLDHVGNCQRCSGTFADSFEEDELIEAPLGFQEKVQIKIKSNKQSNMKFGFYCAKVAVAAGISLMVLFSSELNFLADKKASYVKPPDLSIVNSISTNLNMFSQKIIKLEVFNND